jgi:membrane-associated PAP2 superfamily phosphatase
MNRTGLIVALSIAVVASLVFGLYPELDLRAARYFHAFVDDSRNYFAFRIYPPMMIARDVGLWIGTLLIAPAVIALIVKLCLPHRKLLVSGRAIVFLMATLALGPGLLVNVVLKDHWNRPRPIDVTHFGGKENFVPWWDPRGNCERNCSFVSGDVSGAFWTVAPAALAPPQWRALAYGGALVLGTAMGAFRVMAGGHFISDAIFAGVFTFLIVWLVYGWIYRWPRTRLSEEEIDGRLERAGIAIRDALAWIGYRAGKEIAGPEAGEESDDRFKRRRRGWW